MSTPKRRKTNAHKSSPQTVRSLDFFFNKQNNERPSDHSRSLAAPSATEPQEDIVSSPVHVMTDEELARKLQKQWDEQDMVCNHESRSIPAIQPGTRSGSRDKSVMNDVQDSSESRKLASGTEKSSDDCDALVERSSANIGGIKDTLALQSTASDEDAVSSSVAFDENPLTFNPAIYLPSLTKHWATQGGDASYGLLTRCFALVNSTQSRIKIVDTLVNFLRIIIEGDPESLLPAVGHRLSASAMC